MDETTQPDGGIEPAEPLESGEAALPPEPAEPLDPPNPPNSSEPPLWSTLMESSWTSVAVVGLAFVVAAAVIIMLLIHSVGLQARINQLAAKSQRQPDRSTQPGGINSTQLLVISAEFGSGQHFADVTDRVNELLRSPGAEFYARPDSLQGDPTPGWKKEMLITFMYQGKRHLFTVDEGGLVSEAAMLGATQ